MSITFQNRWKYCQTKHINHIYIGGQSIFHISTISTKSTSAIPTFLSVVPHAAAAPKAAAARVLEALHGVQVHEPLLTEDASQRWDLHRQSWWVGKKRGGSDDLTKIYPKIYPKIITWLNMFYHGSRFVPYCRCFCCRHSAPAPVHRSLVACVHLRQHTSPSFLLLLP